MKGGGTFPWPLQGPIIVGITFLISQISRKSFPQGIHKVAELALKSISAQLLASSFKPHLLSTCCEPAVHQALGRKLQECGNESNTVPITEKGQSTTPRVLTPVCTLRITRREYF